MDPERRETVKRLFEQAYALPDEERSAFLDEKCAGDPELRSELSSLIRAADGAEPFFDELEVAVNSPPPVTEDPTWCDAEHLVARTVRQYRIEEKLGSGGMGVVYRAHDTRLDRTVALKFLPPHVVADEVATERFVVEARAAAALDHPNVCTVHEIGRDDEGRPFIAMAYYEGETLKEKLARGALPVEEAADYAAQIAAGLAAAHKHGIVHRDVKPGNVIVTSDGVAKVLDFGLAKLADVTLTGTGVTLGTVAYMSPEQTRAEQLDARTDLWSLGVVFYEMLTGQRPFQGDRQGAVIHAIRHDEPQAPGELREEVSPALEALVLGLLSKDPEARDWPRECPTEELVPGVGGSVGSMSGRFPGPEWLPLGATAAAFLAASWVVLQVAERLVEQLGLPSWILLSAIILLLIGFPIVMATAFVQSGLRQNARENGPSSVGTLPRAFRQRIFTWRNALLGGGAALALLVCLAAGWVITRTLGVGPAATLMARGMLEERDPILLAEFEAAPADSMLATSVTELVRIDLGRSPVLRLAESTAIRQALGLMERDPASRLDRALTREVAVRAGIGAYITGDLKRLGPAFVLTAVLTATETDSPLWTGREIASDSAGIINAVERLSRSLRERVGESLGSLSQSAPLPRVTTSSLQALEKFALARRISGIASYEQRLALLEEAIDEDSTFAMAHAFLGILMWDHQATTVLRQNQAFETAMRLSERLPDTERYFIRGLYHAIVKDDWNRAAAEWRTLVEIRPEHSIGWRGIAVASLRAGDLTKMHQANLRAVEANPHFVAFVVNSFIDVVGDLDAADSVVTQYEQRYGERPWSRWARNHVVTNRGDWPAMKQRHMADLEFAQGSFLRGREYLDLALIHLVGGRLDSAESNGRTAMRLFEDAGQAADYLSMACELADLALLRGDRAGALSEVATARARFPLDSLGFIERLYSRLAYFYASVGETGEAKQLLGKASEELERKASSDFARGITLSPLSPVGMVAVAEGRPEEAIEVFQEEASEYPLCRLCGPARLGLAWDSAGVADSTIAYYESYLKTLYSHRLWFDAHHLANILERLGQLHDERGDQERAAEYHARFVELWKDADPELQPRVGAAQQRLEEIFAERG